MKIPGLPERMPEYREILPLKIGGKKGCARAGDIVFYTDEPEALFVLVTTEESAGKKSVLAYDLKQHRLASVEITGETEKVSVLGHIWNERLRRRFGIQ